VRKEKKNEKKHNERQETNMKNKNILTRGHNFFFKNQLNEGEKRGR
jgi:hypothetical protein